MFFPKGVGSTEIVTAKSSEMNIMVPKPGGQDMVSPRNDQNSIMVGIGYRCKTRYIVTVCVCCGFSVLDCLQLVHSSGKVTQTKKVPATSATK